MTRSIDYSDSDDLTARPRCDVPMRALCSGARLRQTCFSSFGETEITGYSRGRCRWLLGVCVIVVCVFDHFLNAARDGSLMYAVLSVCMYIMDYLIVLSPSLLSSARTRILLRACGAYACVLWVLRLLTSG